MKKLIILLFLAAALISGCNSVEDTGAGAVEATVTATVDGEAPAEGLAEDGPGGDMPGGGAPPGPPPGSASQSSMKVSATEGTWSFDVVTTTSGNEAESYSVITYYAGKTDEIVIVPSVLGGAAVKEIAAQAFGHHSEIRAVYLPESLEKVEDWGFYDLNEAEIISFANGEVEIGDGAFQSSGNAVLYLPEDSAVIQAGGKTAVSEGVDLLSAEVVNSEKAAIAGGSYLNVEGLFTISLSDIAALAVPADTESGSVNVKGNRIVFSGPDYEVKVEQIEISEAFADLIGADDLVYTFRSLTPDEAELLNRAIGSDKSFGDVATILSFSDGYYLNGNLVSLDGKAQAFNAKTGEAVERDDDGLFPSTGQGLFKYAAYRDTDQDGDIDELYYSPFSLSYTYNSVEILSENEYLNGLAARDILNPVYLAFANAVLTADGETLTEDKLVISTSSDGEALVAEADEERSLLWATDYGRIEVDTLHGESTSQGNWAKMSYESGLDSYNVEIVMEWGMNALLYATNGGSLSVGRLDGETSTLTARGDGANGIIAGGAGTLAGTTDAPYDTAEVYLYNAELELTGWNNHVADVVYGGYAYLEQIDSVTGIEGSYAVGQASALANDFGNGIVEAVNFHTTVYGNRSAGAYVIGGGVITAEDSRFTSLMDAGLVSASGGTFIIDNSEITGQMAFRNRGGDAPDTQVKISDSTLTAMKDLSAYVTGDTAVKAVEAWETASGSSALIHYMMSDPDMTIGLLCENYNISGSVKSALLNDLSNMAGEQYTDNTPLRSSVLDNTYYNYSAGAFTGPTDYSDVPYLTIGSSFGGFVSAVLEFESAGEEVIISNSEMKNENAEDYNYLIASEAGSSANVVIRDSETDGIIWNEGDVNRTVEGRPGNRSSKLSVSFENSKFTGSFADGSNGLWSVDGLEYLNADGESSSLNGNYFKAEANRGISASFDSESVWIVTSDSYLGSLIIEDGTIINAADGYRLESFIDGEHISLSPGIYSGNIELKIVRE